MIYLKPASLRVYLLQYIKPFLGFAVVWLIASLLGDKYNISKFNKLINLLYSIIRVDFIVVGIVLIAMYAFGRFSYSRLIVFGTILLSSILEIFFATFYFLRNKVNNGFDEPIIFSIKPQEIRFQEDNLNFIDPFLERSELEDSSYSIYENLKEKYLNNQEKIFSFINNNIPLKKIHKAKSLVLNTNTFFNFENIEAESQLYFMNLHKVNDYRRINQYFIQINSNLQTGGFFSSWGETIAERYNYFFNNFPFVIAFVLYSGDAFFRRVIPKLPFIKWLYFAITKGKNRALSKAEILGRLFYCGFNVIALEEIENKLFFIAQKEGKPKEDTNPSYGLFIKMKRVGENSEIINVYKLRTMHPFSEYLQEYIYRTGGGTIDGDGFQNDFRITGWGKFFRKIWFDELPMLINLIRGDLKLVGVRPLSLHKFNLYDKELQNMRTKTKPGLIPPFYADLPETLKELQDSERKYLKNYFKHPFTTDIQYFFKAWWNIIVKRARSK